MAVVSAVLAADARVEASSGLPARPETLAGRLSRRLRPRLERGPASVSGNAADPRRRQTRRRPDHNRVRDVPSPTSALGLAPPPPTA